MKNNENGWLFYTLIAVIYAVIFGILAVIFNFFTEEKTPFLSILFQSIFFGIFMTAFDYWLMRKKRKK